MNKFNYVIAAIAFGSMAQTTRAEIIISPRVSYYFDNSNLRVSDLSPNARPNPQVDLERQRILDDLIGDEADLITTDEGAGRVADQTTFPMFGGAITIVDEEDQFTFTAMYGSGNSDVDTVFASSQTLFIVDTAIDDISVVRANDRIETDKLDVEFTWQRRLNENFAVFTGLRYERLATSGPVTITTRRTNQIDTFFAELLGDELPTQLTDARPRPVRLDTKSRLETYSLRAGVTAFVPVNQSLTAFFNGMVHGSYQPDYTVTDTLFGVNDENIGINQTTRSGEFSAGPDIAVGAQFLITDNISLDLRYRAILFFPLSGAFSFSDARVNHGVNLGVSFRL